MEAFAVEKARVFDRERGAAGAVRAGEEERVRRLVAGGEGLELAEDAGVADEGEHAISLKAGGVRREAEEEG
jgi:hypothetical protein